ncbi:MAG: peptide chain release factor N(5)-glutamine methyltransferase [Candidatus Cloacimonetes bacterium]|nr:peptide chain release factor N(5)-glutamine methyltransferase [Candidatus Cloacimonadota bacterium]
MKNWSILEVLNWTTSFFAEKGVPSPRVDAEWLIAHVLELKRIELYTNFQKPLSPAERERIRNLVVRRANREPLQYCLGNTQFMDFELEVCKTVLIPRPETEQLIELIQNWGVKPTSILDIGTGSGAIAIALAKCFPQAEVTAVDISTEALKVARRNAGKYNVDIQFIQSDLFSKSEGKFDLIVSNPPYISTEEYATLEPEITNFEPKEALLSGNKGLEHIRGIVIGAKKHLSNSGLLFLEIGHKQAESVVTLAKEQRYSNIEIRKDMNGIERFVVISW